MPGMYTGSDYDLAGFAVGIVEKADIIENNRVNPGDQLIGLLSSGPHSNGYSLIRKVLEVSAADTATPFPMHDGSDGTLGRALLAPTRIYVKPILDLLEHCQIDGMAHITGGGLTENIVRVLPADLGLEIDLSSWTPPPVFNWLQEQGNIRESEMLRTFNHGIGMVLLVDNDNAAEVSRRLEDSGELVFPIGQCVPHDSGEQVRYLRT